MCGPIAFAVCTTLTGPVSRIQSSFGINDALWIIGLLLSIPAFYALLRLIGRGLGALSRR
jgi:hypothetical protein